MKWPPTVAPRRQTSSQSLKTLASAVNDIAKTFGKGIAPISMQMPLSFFNGAFHRRSFGRNHHEGGPVLKVDARLFALSPIPIVDLALPCSG